MRRPDVFAMAARGPALCAAGGMFAQTGPRHLVFLEDIAGRGHVTRALSPIANLFIHVADSVDVVACARWAG